jgi:DNA invertase Pin-like site-specific DNA recombinase
MNISDEELLNSISEVVAKQITELKKEFQPKEPSQYLTRNEVAKMLKIDLSTVHNYSNKGILKRYSMGGRVYYLRSEVEKALVPLKSKGK